MDSASSFSSAPTKSQEEGDEKSNKSIAGAAVPTTDSSNEHLQQRWNPWVFTILSFYAFVLLWSTIIYKRYFGPDQDWKFALPGLDATPQRKLSMGGHIVFGMISLFFGLIQLIPAFRDPSRRQAWIHRWSGRVFATSAILTASGGLIFIALKQRLSGGYNMTFAFAASGFSLLLCTYQAWVTARRKEFGAHRVWALRSFSHILAAVFYRHFYLALGMLNLHRYARRVADADDACDLEQELCSDYFRLVDAIHCWTHWILPLLLVEAYARTYPAKLPKSTVDKKDHTSSYGYVSSPFYWNYRLIMDTLGMALGLLTLGMISWILSQLKMIKSGGDHHDEH